MISDIHGCIKPFLQLINEVNYKPHKDSLILLGDYVDRGPDSRLVVEEVKRLVREDGAIALQGNHDERFVEVVNAENPLVSEKFMTHGGQQTMESYAGAGAMLEAFRQVVSSRYADHLTFMNGLPYYYEDDHFIYVHAGIHPRYADNWKEQPKRDFLYRKEPFLSQPTATGKTVIFGHTRTSELHGKPDVWFGEGKIGIDGGCAYGQQLNALVIYGPDHMEICAVPA